MFHDVTCQETIDLIVTEVRSEYLSLCFADIRFFAAVRNCTWLGNTRNECIKLLLDYTSCLTLYSLAVSILFHMQ